MAVAFTSQEIAKKYDGFARWYNLVEGVPDLLGVRRLRERLLRRALGRVLEVAVGTGKNLRYYPESSRITAVDLSREMLNLARERSAKLSMNLSFFSSDAEALPFHDHSFDTVVSSLSSCTFPNPVSALREMARVCKPAGRILLLEHGRSDREWLAGWQDRRADSFAKRLGCHWNREPLKLVREAGLTVLTTSATFFGIFRLIEARPYSR